jgi:hypothetical protein
VLEKVITNYLIGCIFIMSSDGKLSSIAVLNKAMECHKGFARE